MTRRYFGTDGIRGTVGRAPITADFMLKLGWAAGQVLRRETGRTRVLIGKDTRISGYMFESALEAGFSAAGVDVALLGPMPTPGIAYLTRTFRAEAGVVISASHNPFDDNGIKFFSADGTKLPDALEARIEAMLDEPLTTADAADLGKAMRIHDAPGRYIEFCKSTLPERLSLHGLRIVLDCANGATYHIAPNVFRELGADVSIIGAEPDGVNINRDVGSTHPASLRAAVIHRGADLGIAFDGDGDRVLLVDPDGHEIDGDDILYLIARDRQSRGVLNGGVVGTLMTNFGLAMALETLGIPFERAKVGDRFVMERMAANGWELGGEPSGHVICAHTQTTGDGIVSALQVVAIMIRQSASLPALLDQLEKVPQVLVNVRLPAGTQPTAAMASPELARAVADIEAQLGDEGRVLLRPSGTEPLVRVMVEGRAHLDVDGLARTLAGQVQALLD
ncbi:MAG: phosphoglucosamine mutase [Halomonas sp.]|nr:phosphoglucosamine mutase [Halomonas sp.]MDN6298488.1 phosphoglucosamine mutase [Halomonas sp.]MDN6314916.1 phosphoglucosamine mutase [Halomonas sp.]MDN6336288.1 phosphoglucosamine mutase [Halomonas sp.]